MADTTERHIALREAHQFGASDSFFAARKKLRDTEHERYIFDAGFRRGFDAHESLQRKKDAIPPTAQTVDVANICNAYESGVGHRGRPTANVNPYREGTPEHEAYAIGAKAPAVAAVDDEATDTEVDAIGEILYAAGWRDKADALGDGLRAAIPKLRAKLAKPAPVPVPPAEAKVADDVVLLPAEATDEMQDNMRQALIDQGWDSDSAGEVDFADLWHAGVYEYQERTAAMLAAKAKGGGK